MSDLTLSTIPEWFAGKKLFITGGTGFVGKIIIEKLLRSCPDIDTIYILIRTKKGVNPKQRFEDFTNQVVFSKLKEKNPDCFQRLKLIKGDVTEEDLGICSEDHQELVQNVEIVIHCAATVRFVLPLKESAEFNVLGTWRMLELAKEMKKLVSFVHVSTAFCQEIGQILEERGYPTEHDPTNVIEMTKVLDANCMEMLKPRLMRKNYCNTYTYTKALAEVLCSKYQDVLPIAIARPSVIIIAKKEPFVGYTEYTYGPNGMAIAGSHGILRTLYCKGDLPTCYIPVDTVANATIAIAWDRGIKTQSHILPYYNIVESETCITWDGALNVGNVDVFVNPYSKMMWYPFGGNEGNYYKFKILFFLLHYIPGFFIDLIMILMRRKPVFTKLYKKIEKGMMEYSHFLTKRWSFENDNLRALYKRLSESDKETFDFDIWNMDWEAYIRNYNQGLRRFVVKDPLENIPKARKLLKKLYILDRVTRAVLVGLVLWFFWNYASAFIRVLTFGLDSTRNVFTSFKKIT
uniref:Fatty acyl-CoA reductase n=1 Tax=Culicoides sonorensis TaxID=179676 RepID=A0A336MTV2_CULSO